MDAAIHSSINFAVSGILDLRIHMGGHNRGGIETWETILDSLRFYCMTKSESAPYAIAVVMTEIGVDI